MITFNGKKNEVDKLLSKLNCELRPSGQAKWKWAIFDLNNLVWVGYYSELTGQGELRVFELDGIYSEAV